MTSPAIQLIAELYPDATPHLGGLRASFADGGIGRIDIRLPADDLVWISHLLIEAEAGRDQGYGGRELARLSEAADRHAVALALEAFWRPDLHDGGWLPRLYGRFGFEAVGGPDDQGMQEFIRPPCPADPFPAVSQRHDEPSPA